MSKIKCIIIEDEPIAAGILEDYINQIEYLELLQTYDNALDALARIKGEKVDLMFLDIHLPVIKGLQFLRSLKNPPKVIVTTAYHQYAVEGFELDVLDYLLKPFSFERFLLAINKLKVAPQTTLPIEKEDFFFVSSSKRKVKIHIENILYIEGSKEYVNIFTEEDLVRTKMPLYKVEEMLPPIDFIRVHRSFIVASKKIKSYDHSIIEIGDKFIPVGKIYKEQFISKMN